MPITRVLLVDDLVMLADALALRLSSVPDMLLLGRYATGDPDLIRDVATLVPDVIVIDPAPAGASAGRLLTALRQGRPQAQIVVLTGSSDTNLAVMAAKAGVASWVDKASSTDHLVEVLRGVRNGQAWFPAPALGAILRALREEGDEQSGPSHSLDALSPREHEVLAAIAAGKSPDVIARELSISVNTVRTHTSSILTKLGVHSRLAARAWPPRAD